MDDIGEKNEHANDDTIVIITAIKLIIMMINVIRVSVSVLVILTNGKMNIEDSHNHIIIVLKVISTVDRRVLLYYEQQEHLQ